jgi:hypothetical protein
MIGQSRTKSRTIRTTTYAILSGCFTNSHANRTRPDKLPIAKVSGTKPNEHSGLQPDRTRPDKARQVKTVRQTLPGQTIPPPYKRGNVSGCPAATPRESSKKVKQERRSCALCVTREWNSPQGPVADRSMMGLSHHLGSTIGSNTHDLHSPVLQVIDRRALSIVTPPVCLFGSRGRASSMRDNLRQDPIDFIEKTGTQYAGPPENVFAPDSEVVHPSRDAKLAFGASWPSVRALRQRDRALHRVLVCDLRARETGAEAPYSEKNQVQALGAIQ